MPVPIYPGVILSSLGFAEGLSLLSSFYKKFENIVLHFLPNPVTENLSGVWSVSHVPTTIVNKHYQHHKHKHKQSVIWTSQACRNQ